ncbi:AraC family transcriptional regulator [Arenibaculum pallidiluteum]|uniref:AraC family transcriptional regulator n=1 Tax=Arenibaculum pallidiluteum TaxID=2812559 RepID=UPI002E282A69|nr:AraC family transcriptional regulator [Arenibaculum pallidiluteum]
MRSRITTRHATRIDYARRVERAIAHIAAHLDAPLDLERLAAVACFSPCHFHRIYRYLAGETAAETVRRLRLNRAAKALVDGAEPVGEIARGAGYGDTVAFTRAFRSAYGVPPAAYRQRRRLAVLHGQEIHPMYRVEFREMAPLRLAAIRHVGPYIGIGPCFDRLGAWAEARNITRGDARMVGIYHDDPGSVPAAALRSDAGVTLDAAAEAAVAAECADDGPIRLLTLDGGRHAVILHRGPYAELERAYRWLYQDWLPGSGEEAADRPCFEVYLNSPRSLPPADWLTEIHLPLAGTAPRAV